MSADERALTAESINGASSLLGLVLSAIGDELSDAYGVRGWVERDTYVRLTWGGSLPISQVLVIILTGYGEFTHETANLVSGVPGLRLAELNGVHQFDENQARLLWSSSTDVTLALSHNPRLPWLNRVPA